MWFEKLTGFYEESPAQVRENLTVEDGVLKSLVNGEEYKCGLLETPSLGELRNRVFNSKIPNRTISVKEVVSDVQTLHCDKSNSGSLFQVASQFNLLEMPSPQITPEQGVGDYENDHTQGPACAVAAGAGTIYRNYFADVNGKKGQSFDNQIDCLADLGKALGNSDNHLWEMKNGYAFASEFGLREIASKIRLMSEHEIDDLRKLLRIGVQWDTEVTISNSKHTVSQAYCSALPVAYSQLSAKLWVEFARIILEASYEATICAGILNYLNTGNNKLYLTLIGGGVFGNEMNWIIDALHRSLLLYKDVGLDVAIVSRRTNSHIQELVC
jgi:hypothetical protein